MATFIALGNFTDQGIRNVKDSVKRADAVKEAAQKAGITMKEIVWTLGSYDMVVTFEAPDDAAMTAFALAVGSAGNVRTQTLRAFNRSEMSAILAKVG
ncbi:MAG: GYD domain-containing protein [Burkholderiales bacterium]|nr:MAG: GYD domain-containing protein [Burkholderiales bacterium]